MSENSKNSAVMGHYIDIDRQEHKPDSCRNDEDIYVRFCWPSDLHNSVANQDLQDQKRQRRQKMENGQSVQELSLTMDLFCLVWDKRQNYAERCPRSNSYKQAN